MTKSGPSAGPRPGDAVAVGERSAIFLYRSGPGAVVRFAGQTGTRVVPFAKVRCGG